MEHERLYAPALRGPDLALAAMRYLAEQCAVWPLVQDLVQADVQQWPRMRERERKAAFERTLRRAVAVAPWVLDKGRVRDAARALDGQDAGHGVGFRPPTAEVNS